MTKSDLLAQFIDHLGLRHFRGKELTWLWSRTRKGVANSVPPENLWHNVIHPLIVLDEIRERLREPITITSAYRSPAYNEAVGGERMSYHKVFGALDFTTPAGARAAAQVARSLRGTRFVVRFPRPGDAASFTWRGGIGVYPKFVHIDARGVDANW